MPLRRRLPEKPRSKKPGKSTIILSPATVEYLKEHSTSRQLKKLDQGRRQSEHSIRLHIKKLRGQGVKGRAKLRKLTASDRQYWMLAK